MTPLIFVLLTLLSITTASPTLHRRGLPGAVYTCTLPNFRGDCQWSAPTLSCRQPGPASLGFGISSLGPDPGTSCILYDKFDCTGREVVTVRFPGLSDNIPTFTAFKCSVDSSQASDDGLNPVGALGTVEGKGKGKAYDPQADPRLAGGVGSLERKERLGEIEEMERDGFKEGLIGARKGVYY